MGGVANLPGRVTPRQRGRPKTRVGKAARRQQIINLLLAGASEAEIAQTLSVSPAVVSKVVLSILDTWEQQEQAAVEKIRALQLARIDRLVRAHWNAAIGLGPDGTSRPPSVAATDAIRKLETLRSQIAGTQAAQKVIHSGSIGFSLDPAEVAQADQAWLASGGEVVEGTADELASG